MTHPSKLTYIVLCSSFHLYIFSVSNWLSSSLCNISAIFLLDNFFSIRQCSDKIHGSCTTNVLKYSNKDVYTNTHNFIIFSMLEKMVNLPQSSLITIQLIAVTLVQHMTWRTRRRRTHDMCNFSTYLFYQCPKEYLHIKEVLSSQVKAYKYTHKNVLSLFYFNS